MKKKSTFKWLFLFIILTTFYSDFNKTNFVECFKLKQIEINGVKNADANLINLRLEYFKDQNILFLKQEEIANAIISLDFIDKVGIKKIYPDKIKLQIEEYKIIAVINDDSKKYVLGENGNIIKKYKNNFDTLPIVYGQNTSGYFPEFYKFLKETNFKTEEVEYFKFLETNRWDVYLKNGKLIKLPEDKDKMRQSIKKFISINKDDKFNKFKIFDFRVKNQLIIK